MSSDICYKQKLLRTQPVTPMPDSWMSSNVYYRKTAAHPTHHTNAIFMDIGCQVMYSIHQKNCCTPNPSHQCQIPGCQAMYATDNRKTAAHPQPVAPKLDPWMDVKWCILQNKTKNAARPTCRINARFLDVKRRILFLQRHRCTPQSVAPMPDSWMLAMYSTE